MLVGRLLIGVPVEESLHWPTPQEELAPLRETGAEYDEKEFPATGRQFTTKYVEEPVTFPMIPSFAPEHFAVARCADAGRFKQFRRGIDNLDDEGVVQVLRSDLRGDQAPVFAAVGPLPA